MTPKRVAQAMKSIDERTSRERRAMTERRDQNPKKVYHVQISVWADDHSMLIKSRKVSAISFAQAIRKAGMKIVNEIEPPQRKPKRYKGRKYNVEASRTMTDLVGGFEEALRHDTD